MAEQHAESQKSSIVGRQELTKQIAAAAGLTQKKSAEVLEATLASIQEALKNGNEVRLVGFGSFKVRRSAARKGVNPRSGRSIEVPEKERVRFSPGKELSDAVSSYDPPAGTPPHIPRPPR
jgi:nucleoid DNA-binding protein